VGNMSFSLCRCLRQQVQTITIDKLSAQYSCFLASTTVLGALGSTWTIVHYTEQQKVGLGSSGVPLLIFRCAIVKTRNPDVRGMLLQFFCLATKTDHGQISLRGGYLGSKVKKATEPKEWCISPLAQLRKLLPSHLHVQGAASHTKVWEISLPV